MQNNICASDPKSACEAAFPIYIGEANYSVPTHINDCPSGEYPGWRYPEGGIATVVQKSEVLGCSQDLSSIHEYWGSCDVQVKRTLLCPEIAPIVLFNKTGAWGVNWWSVSTPNPTLIGFFNGVANTKKEGEASLFILKAELPTTPEKPVEYELFYNQSGCKEGATGKLSCLQDVAEVFEQRSTELSGVLGNRWEVFWEILAGKHQQPGSLTSTLLSRLVDTASALFGLIDSIFSNVITRFASAFTNLLSLINSPPTVADKEAHLAKLKTYADKGSGMVLVAHSQGNLFVNAAYDSIKASHPSVKAEVVHVAPASPTLRGGYGLADIDLVINALRLTGVTSVPPNNILGMPPSKDDMTGHSFGATYMDKARAAYTDIKTKLTAAFGLASQ